MPWVKKAEYDRLKAIDRLRDVYEIWLNKLYHDLDRLRALDVWLVQQAIDVPHELSGCYDTEDECTGKEPPLEGAK